MARRRGERRETCSVVGCNGEAVRSLSRRKVTKALPDLDVEEGRRSHLCKEHYKRFKKATRVERTIDRLTW